MHDLHSNAIHTTAAGNDRLAPAGSFAAGRSEPNSEAAHPMGVAIGGAESFSSDGNPDKHLKPVDGHNPLGEKSGGGFLNATPSKGHGYFDKDTQSLLNIAATTLGMTDKVDGDLKSTTAEAEQNNKQLREAFLAAPRY